MNLFFFSIFIRIVNYKFNIYRKIIILFFIILIADYKNNSTENNLELDNNYLNVQFDLNLTFPNKLEHKIKIAVYYTSIKNGGIERVNTLFLNYLNKAIIFKIYLLTHNKQENEYPIPIDIKRIIINPSKKNNLIKFLNREKIDILIYHFYNDKEMEALNNLKYTKTIFYNHSCFFIWIYAKMYYFFRTIYNAYKNSKYIISLIPFENNYLFKKWGINSVLMNNFITYNYHYVIPSDLSSKLILMIGRASDRLKRFDLGLKAMHYILKEIPEAKLKIISNIYLAEFLLDEIKQLKLEKSVEFIGYISNPEIYFKNASLHLFPTISESFGLVLSETKIFGIPNILLGLDYVSLAKGGTIIIYDDNSLFIARESLKILKNEKYRKKLGKEARKSMKKFNNELLLKKWIKLILSIYNGEKYYDHLRKQETNISINNAVNILENQIKLLNKRLNFTKNITIENLENFTFMKNLEYYF